MLRLSRTVLLAPTRLPLRRYAQAPPPPPQGGGLNQSNWADLILNLAEQTDKMLPQLEPIRSGQRDGRDDRGRGGYQRRGDQREGGGEGGYRGGRGGYGRATSGRIPQGSEELSRARKNQGPSRYGDKWEARGRGATRPPRRGPTEPPKEMPPAEDVRFADDPVTREDLESLYGSDEEGYRPEDEETILGMSEKDLEGELEKLSSGGVAEDQDMRSQRHARRMFFTQLKKKRQEMIRQKRNETPMQARAHDRREWGGDDYDEDDQRHRRRRTDMKRMLERYRALERGEDDAAERDDEEEEPRDEHRELSLDEKRELLNKQFRMEVEEDIIAP